MHAAILGLGTAVPPHIFPQMDTAEKFSAILNLDERKTAAIRQLYKNSAITKRHSILNEFNEKRENWNFWGHDFPKTIPGMSERNEIYKNEAPKLAYEASLKALNNWNGNPASITHVISISCTGVVAPGLEFGLMQALKLNPSVNRLGINFMGCFGAFKGLSVAQAFAKENPKNRILVVCTELCSLHLQVETDSETMIGNSLFSDGASAVIMGAEPGPSEKPLWEIFNSHTLGVEKSLDKMSWEASSKGYLMRLSHTVPVYLGRAIEAFTDALLPKNLKAEECDWPIHPGGKSILQSIEKRLQISSQHTQASWKTLANYGNMSSATFFFVLEELRQQKKKREWAAGLAFGPGLSIEGVLLRNKEAS
ncbi:MAG: type III polyketide synthase [Candidatus Protochlamydia sp.]|nr:type III polyketide synthase [Candidatus Protochlamydia sp.]